MKTLIINLFDYVGYKIRIISKTDKEYYGDATYACLAIENREDYRVNEDSIDIDSYNGFYKLYLSEIKEIKIVGPENIWV